MEEDYARTAGIVMAAQELLPAQPSDLTAILRDCEQRDALLRPAWETPRSSELVSYLREHTDPGRIERWHKVIDELTQRGVARPVLAGTPDYPARLAECWDAPPLLFATAQIPADPAIAIVGSRDTTHEVLTVTREVAATVASAGVVVVSGLAAGVDGAAHRGALDAAGQTVAVMGTGITQIFPQQNEGLAEEIRRHGVLLSQFAPYAPRTKTTFLRRNHVIAGLSDVSLVMAGQHRSGTRYELDQAIAYRRPVLMWAPTLGGERWAKQLADSGAARFTSSSEDILDVLREVEY